MRILHVIPSLDPAEGGPSFAVKAMAEALVNEGVEVTIATTAGAQNAPVICDGLSVIGEESLPENASTERRGYRVVSFRREFEPYKISFGLARWLGHNVTKFDLIHIHALFSFSSTMAARIARKKNVPYIVRPLGVLNRWGMENRRRIPKLVSFRLVELPILLHAAVIHYTSETERMEAGELNEKLARHSSVVIPLPIEQRAWSKEQRAKSGQQFLVRFPRVRGKRVVLFLSRIDPKKGIELLLEAFAIVREKEKDVALVIAGDGEKSYVRELRERARRLFGSSAGGNARPTREEEEEEGAIIWTGHLSGEMKAAALAAATIFVLPSYSENFGIAAAEAFAVGLPCVLSENVGLSDEAQLTGAALVTKCDITELASAITTLMLDPEKRARMGKAARQFASERLSLERIGRQLQQEYHRSVKRSGFLDE